MKKILSLSAALALMTVASPALAQNRGMVVLTPGASSNWVQQQPTAFITTEMAQVLPDGLAYISTGGSIGNLPGATLNYRRGMGGRGELGIGLGLSVLPTFGATVEAGWKQQIATSANMATAFNVDLYALGLGAANTIGATVGLPLTFDVGMGHLTVQPRVNFPALTAGTANASAQAALGLITPIANRVSLLAEVTPSYMFAGGFSVPVGVGARFSPTATSHIDFSVGNLSTSNAFSLGLINIIGHVGF